MPRSKRKAIKPRIITVPRSLAAIGMAHRRIKYEMAMLPGQTARPGFVLFGPCPTQLPTIGRPSEGPPFGTGIVPQPDVLEITFKHVDTDTNVVEGQCPWCHRWTLVTNGELVDWLNNTKPGFGGTVEPASKEVTT